MEKSEIQQLNSLNKKELDAFEKLFFEYHGRLVLFALKFTGDIDDAKDIVQNVFLALWEKAGDIHTSPKSYLFQSVKNSCLNYKRKIQIENTLKDDLVNKIIAVEKSLYLTKEDPLQSLLEKELEQKIEEIVADLPEKCQLVFKLSRKKNLQNKEIAEKLGISIKTVEKHITTALSVLRKEMTDYLIIVLPLIFLK
jgi:RNA polymerase sigma-70 factor, ECF subfamily